MKCAVSISVNGRRYQQEVEPRLLLVHFLRDAGLTGTKIGCDTSQCGACTVLMDGVAVEVVHHARRAGRRRERHDDRGARRPTASSPAAGGVLGEARPAVRLLHAGDGVRRARDPAHQSQSVGRTDPARPRRQHVPLHRLPEHRPRGAGRGRRSARGRIGGATMTTASRSAGTRVRIGHPPARGSAAPHRARRATRPTSRCPGMVHAAILRSPHGHARIRGIDTSRAKRAPGVVAVFTGADTRGRAQADSVRVAAAQRRAEDRAVSRHRQRRRPLRRRCRRGRRRRVRLPGVRRARPDRRRLRAAARRRRSAEGDARPARRSCTPEAPGNVAFHWTVAGGDVDAAFKSRRGRGARSHHPAAPDSDRDGAARRRRAVHAGDRRADALEHDAEPAHRPLHHVARHRRAGGSPARRSRRKSAAASAARSRRSRATSSPRSAR